MNKENITISGRGRDFLELNTKPSRHPGTPGEQPITKTQSLISYVCSLTSNYLRLFNV